MTSIHPWRGLYRWGNIAGMNVPAAIEEVVRTAPHVQSGIAWPRRAWVARFPHLADSLQSLPDLVDRAEVKRHARGASEGPGAAEWGFVVAMVWGYGTTGYGPWRVQQMFSSIEDPQGALCRAAAILRDEGAISAYSLLGGEARMFKLGPAFGTKFLYFCDQPRAGYKALILDRLVARWLRDHTQLILNPVPWSVRTYQLYLDTMHEWAEELSVRPDEVERAIFQKQAATGGGQWA